MSTIGRIVDTVCYIESLLIIGRVLISWFDVDYGNPIIRALRAVTDPVLRIFRPILPTFAGIDLSPVLAIITLRIIGRAFSHLGDPHVSIGGILVDVLDQLFVALLVIVIIIVFLRIVLVFFQADPWHPATRMVRDMSRPLTAPFALVRVRSRQVDMPAIVALVVYIVVLVIGDHVLGFLRDHVS